MPDPLAYDKKDTTFLLVTLWFWGRLVRGLIGAYRPSRMREGRFKQGFVALHRYAARALLVKQGFEPIWGRLVWRLIGAYRPPLGSGGRTTGAGVEKPDLTSPDLSGRGRSGSSGSSSRPDRARASCPAAGRASPPAISRPPSQSPRSPARPRSPAARALRSSPRASGDRSRSG